MTADAPVFAKYQDRELNVHRKKVFGVGWNQSGKRLATGSSDGAIKIWTIEPHSHGSKEKPDADLSGHQGSVDQLFWSPVQDDILASASSDKTLRIWDARSPRSAAKVAIPDQCLCMAWSPRGTEIGVACKDDHIVVLDARSHKLLTKKRPLTDAINSLVWAAGGKVMLVTTEAGTLEVLGYPGLDSRRSLAGHTASCYGLAVDPEERFAATCGADALLCLWDLQHMACIGTFMKVDHPMRVLSFSHDGKYLAVSCDNETKVRIIQVEGMQQVWSLESSQMCDALSWNPAHLVLAYAGEEETVVHDRNRSYYGTYGHRAQESTTHGPVHIFAPP